jgi:hypothetical protein
MSTLVKETFSGRKREENKNNKGISYEMKGVQKFLEL